MKKFISFILVFLLVFLTNCFNVYALESSTLELIPATETVSVEAEHFSYSDMTYSAVDKEFKINYFKNNTSDSTYMGVNILLFDMEKKNIGFIPYCTKKDITGKNAQQKINPGAEAILSIDVKDKYLVGSNTAYDVYYYAILDDNFECRSHGNNKYEGLTIEEIKKGKVSSKYNEDILWMSEFFNDFSFKSFIVFLGVIVLTHLIISFITFILFKKVYTKYLYISFVPIVNMIVAIKLAFGYVVASLLSIFLIVSIIFLFKGKIVLLIIFGIFLLISLIVCIYKRIVGNYRLLFVEDMVTNYIKNHKRDEDIDDSNDSGNQLLDLSFNNKKSDDGIELADDESGSVGSFDINPADINNNVNNIEDSIKTADDMVNDIISGSNNSEEVEEDNKDDKKDKKKDKKNKHDDEDEENSNDEDKSDLPISIEDILNMNDSPADDEGKDDDDPWSF